MLRAYQSYTLPGQFIPSNLSHVRSKKAYVGWIKQQQEYLDTHRNISIKNISQQEMKERKVEHGGSSHILQDILVASPLIKNLLVTAKTDSNGVWNLSTTSTMYNEAVSFINSILNKENETLGSTSKGSNNVDDYNSYLCQSTITSESNSFSTSSQEFNNSTSSIPSNIDSKKEAADSSPSSIDENCQSCATHAR